MAMWKKALVLVVAILVVVLPVVTQLAMAQTVPVRQERTQIVIPQGKELSDTQLQKTNGEGAVLALIGAVIAGVWTYEEERYAGQKPNPWAISKSAILGAAAGLGIPVKYDAMVVSATTSALRWGARAAAAGAFRVSSLASKITYGFNHYIGGPIRRFFTHGR